MTKEKIKDVATRASKTFIQAFVGSITIDSFFGVTDLNAIKRIGLSVLVAGVAAGVIANALKKVNFYLSVILAALAAPVVNTGIFAICMVLFFKDTLTVWANGANLAYYIIFGLIGINFLIELILNAVLSPVIVTVARAFKKELKTE